MKQDRTTVTWNANKNSCDPSNGVQWCHFQWPQM